MKALLFVTFNLISIFGYSQNNIIDSIQVLIKETIIIGATDTESLEKEIELRTELLGILKDSIEANSTELDTSQQTSTVDHKALDSLIAETYLKTQIEEDDTEARIELQHYMNLKQNTDGLSLGNSAVAKQENWERLLKDQEFELEDLQERIKIAKPTVVLKKEEEKKPTEKRREDVFNTSSIVSQVIAASVESGQEFKPKAEVDNKLFEDRKAFMNWPLNNSRVSKRYSSASQSVQFSSQEAEVHAIAQGTVIYSKKLADGGYTMVIKHDNNYFSVYSNLIAASMSYGQYVGYGQKIATAKSSADGSRTVVFEIWKNKSRVNPMHWLKNG